MKKQIVFIALAAALMVACTQKTNNQNEDKMKQVEMTQEWDKVFLKSDKVDHRKVTFTNQYGITLVADMYVPKKDPLAEEGESDSIVKFPAIAVSGPFGAVKEQSSGLYAMRMAERGFVTIAFDPSYTGESSGEPRRTASPDINTEDFMAAVDFLSLQPNVDAERIGIIGICGWGGIALNAAAADTRIKATVASTMYDMTRVSGNGYFDADNNEEARYKARKAMSEQRLKDAAAMAGGVVDPLPEEAPQFVKDYHKTSRGYHVRSGNSNDGWRVIGTQAFTNAHFLYYTNEIRSAVMVMHGEKAHSRYFGEDAYKYMVNGNPAAGIKPNPCPDNKQLLIIPGASHCDHYDGGYTDAAGKGESKNLIPWDTLADFFENNM